MDAILAPEVLMISPEQTAKDLVAEANHRIANSLTLLVGMVRMQATSTARRPTPLSNAEVRLMLEGVAARISTIGQLHRLLSHVPQDGCISLVPHLRDVAGAMVAALSSPEQKVTVEHSGSDCIVLTRQVQPILLIICEAFINAMKYAHPTGVPLVMRIDCAPAADGRLVLTISDDGIGLPDGFDPSRDGGLGFRVIRSLASEIGATLEITSTGLGLSLRLSIPVSAMAGGKPS
jgi:two-component sensor histidine kinase